MAGQDFLALTADIVAAHVANNSVKTSEVPTLIRNVHGALAGLRVKPVAKPETRRPAVSVRASVRPDYIVCLEDGRKLKMMKRYLRAHFDMSPDEYRAKWGLPRDYPMIAPAYAEQRRNLAVSIGLGRKKGETGSARMRGPRPKAKQPSARERRT